MLQNKASMTAIMSAYGRYYHYKNDEPIIFEDFLAEKMIPKDFLDNIPKQLAMGIKFFEPEEELISDKSFDPLKWVIQNQVAPISIARSRYCEDMLELAVKMGVEQYVILGAGLDTFAFRKPELLEKVSIYELDHVDTQRLKKSMIEANKWQVSDNYNLVPIDFNTDNIAEVLDEAGLDKNKITFVSWLGVSYYLTQESIISTLKDVVNILSKGSTIVFDYADEFLFDSNSRSKRVTKMVELAKASGETMKSCFSYLELEKLLEEVNLNIYEHINPEEMNKRYFRNRNDYYKAFENINYACCVVNKQ